MKGGKYRLKVYLGTYGITLAEEITFKGGDLSLR
jgi:hypothetical protein